MDKVAILLLFLINVNLSTSKTIQLRRNTDPIQHINPIGDDPTAQISSPATDLNQATTQLSEFTTVVTQDTDGKLIPRDIQDTDGQKQALRLAYIRDTITPLRTTSEDTLRLLLKKHLPFDHPAPDQIGQLAIGIMHPVSEPLWRFEEYDDKEAESEQVRHDKTNCEGQKIQCLGDSEYNQPVCVYDRTLPEKYDFHWRQKGFTSRCDVDYRNCLKRFELTGKFYADHYSEDYLEFFHYGWCENCYVLVDCSGMK